MNKLEEFSYINELFAQYGALLSKTQYDIMNDYYSYNLSISEISENRNISRAAVNDAISKAKQYLFDYEDKLHVLENNKKTISLLEKIKDKCSDEEKQEIEHLEGDLTNGI